MRIACPVRSGPLCKRLKKHRATIIKPYASTLKWVMLFTQLAEQVAVLLLQDYPQVSMAFTQEEISRFPAHLLFLAYLIIRLLPAVPVKRQPLPAPSQFLR